MEQHNKYIIVREDLVDDPVTIISDGLLIGRLRECELLLNHPSVSRVQAGIKQIEGNYYIFDLRPSNPIKLNRRPIDENEALAAGDVVEVGPFLLDVDYGDDALVIKVALQIGRTPHDHDVSNPALSTTKLEDLDKVLSAERKAPAPRAAPLSGKRALDIFWDKRIREAGKMMRPAQLFPRGQKRTGKAQFNWTPTTDLARHWPVSFFIWGAAIVGVLAVAGAYWYANAYAPAPLSSGHVQSQLRMLPAIAARPNDNACTTCHSFSGNMDMRCAGCHNAEGFVSTVIQPHHDAGIGCTACHAEHKGREFKASEAALFTCTQCHSDSNQATYNSKRVGTPHGGTFGYPVTNGNWIWKGVSDDDWILKQIAVSRLPADNDQQWRSKEFHALHVKRVRASGGLAGDQEGHLSCSSCHNSFSPIDRTTPRQTCGICHNGRIDSMDKRPLIAADKPNCTSCHVQHVKDKRHWYSSLISSADSSLPKESKSIRGSGCVKM